MIQEFYRVTNAVLVTYDGYPNKPVDREKIKIHMFTHNTRYG